MPLAHAPAAAVAMASEVTVAMASAAAMTQCVQGRLLAAQLSKVLADMEEGQQEKEKKREERKPIGGKSQGIVDKWRIFWGYK